MGIHTHAASAAPDCFAATAMSYSQALGATRFTAAPLTSLVQQHGCVTEGVCQLGTVRLRGRDEPGQPPWAQCQEQRLKFMCCVMPQGGMRAIAADGRSVITTPVDAAPVAARRLHAFKELGSLCQCWTTMQ